MLMVAKKKKAAKKKQKQEKPNPRWLDLACGNNKFPGFTGIDHSTEAAADRIIDLEKYPWDIPDGYAKKIFCSHYLEHVSDLIAFMNELWRIMAPGATAEFICPYYNSVRAWQDPTHKRAISEPTFLYFDADWRKETRLSHYPIKTNFKIEKMTHAVNDQWAKKSPEAVQFAALHYWNVINDIHVSLRKPK